MEFRLLGPVEAVDGGRTLSLGGRRQRAVLAHLLLADGAPVSSDALIERVWGDHAPSAVRASLHTYVSRLRTTLGADRLEKRSTGYVLHAGRDEVDAGRFERHLALARSQAADDPGIAAAAYDDALALSRGPALADLADEPSLRPAAQRWDGLVDAARRERIAVGLQLGRHEALVPELEAMLQRDPLGEDLWGHYVLALYRCGRQADALAAFSRARTTLQVELGIEPSPRLRRLHEQVLHQDPALTLTGAALRGYRLLDVLGEGASAVVHRAVQPDTGREVALKSLHPWLADDPEVVRRFAAEAQRAMRLEHPNVVPLHDHWREPGGAFLVMRLLRGGNLAERLERGPLALSTIVRLTEQVAGALTAMAGDGMQDRPLPLEDVLLDEYDNAYLSGFCLARRPTPSSAPAPAVAVATSRVDAAPTGRLLLDVLAHQPASARSVVGIAECAANGGFAEVHELCAALRDAVAPTLPAQRTGPAPLPARNPYKGLRAFGEADAGDFFGRNELVDDLVARLSEPAPDGGRRRFLAVVGPSGSGKSSLVLAGLVPTLRARTPTLYVATMVPGLDPFAELVRALEDVAVQAPGHDAASRLRAGSDHLGELVARLLPPDGGELLIVIDQFEELFTLTGGSDRQAFVAQLADAVGSEKSRVQVVVTLRADFYDRPLGEPALAALVRSATEVVVPLSAEGLEQAVVGPAERVGLRVEPALLAQVVADVGGAPTCLPLLQYALTELVEHRRGEELTLSGYRELGGVRGALVRRADAVWAQMGAEQHSVARRVLLQLVLPDASGAATRRRVLQEELEVRTGDPGTTRAVLTALGSARLVTFDRDPATRAPTVEVAHEALLTEWSLLRQWTDAAREDLRTEHRLIAATRDWEGADRDPSFLATGARLAALEQWSSRWALSGDGATTPLERAYLDASLSARDAARSEDQHRREHELELERRSVRRLRVAASVLAVAVVGMTALAAFGIAQRDRAERESVLAQSRALAAGSAASLVDDPERGVLLALESLRMTRDAEVPELPEAEEALHSAVVASRVQLTLPGIGGALGWSPRGQLVTEGPEESGLVEIRNASDGAVLRSYPGHDADVNDVAFSPDGTRLLTTGDDSAARLWDPATGRLVWELVTTGQVWAPTFSGDGSRMAASWEDEGVVRVVDVATGAMVREVRSVSRPFTTALTHDGDRIVVVGDIDGAAQVLDVATGALVRVVGPGARTAQEVDISPDGQWLVTSGADTRARIWSMADGSLRSTLFGSAPIGDVDWSGDGSRLVAGGDDGIARVFDMKEPTAAREELRLSSNELRGVFGVAFSPDGSRVALGDNNGRATQVYDVELAGSREWLTASVPNDLVGADFTADGEQIIASAPGGGLTFLDAAGGGEVRSTGPARGTVAEIRTSPDGALVAGAVDGAVVVWDVATGAERFAVSSPGWAWELAWSADGSMLAWSDDDIALRVVDRDGRAVPVPEPSGTDDGVISVAFTPDSRRLVAAHRLVSRNVPGTGHVEVVDRASGQVIDRWDMDVNRIDVSPDGRVVAQGTRGGDVVLHDLGTGQQSRTLVGHVGEIWDLDFSGDGRLLATSGQDATVRLWDLETGAQRVALRGHDSVVQTGQFSPDGRRLVTTSGDGTVRVWAVELDDLVQIARDRVTRGLTEQECRRYLQRACG